MKNILIVVRGYYPDISASGNLIKPLIDEIRKDNSVTILALSSKRSVIQLTSNFRIISLKNPKKELNIFWKMIKFIKKNFALKLYDNDIVLLFKKNIEILDKENNYDYVIAITFEEIMALCLSGIEYRKKYSFILEKFNINNAIFFNRKKLIKKFEIESYIFENLKGCFVLPIVYRLYYNSVYSSKLKLLEHPMIVDQVTSKVEKSNIVLFYSGGLDKSSRNPVPIINFLKNLKKTVDFEIHIYSYGNLQNKLKLISSKNKFIKIFDSIPKDQINIAMKNADILISISNNEEDLMPSKIFDYFSTGKPVIHFSQIENDPYDEYLNRYGNFLKINYNDLSKLSIIILVKNFILNNIDTVLNFELIRTRFIECTPSFVKEEILDFLESNGK